MKKYCIYILLLFMFLVFTSCNSNKDSFVIEEQQIIADNEVIGKALKKIVLGYEYKRLYKNYTLPSSINKQFDITWEVSENEFASIKQSAFGFYINVTRPETEFVHFKLTAIIVDENGDRGTRCWDCYIIPKIYNEEDGKK